MLARLYLNHCTVFGAGESARTVNWIVLDSNSGNEKSIPLHHTSYTIEVNVQYFPQHPVFMDKECIMNHQSNPVYDYTTIEMKNDAVLDKRIFINTDCVLTLGHSINKSQPYLLISNNMESRRVNFNVVIWVENFSQDGITFLLFKDLLSHELLQIEHDMTGKRSQCEWMLVDSDHLQVLQKVVERMLIQDYCQTG